MDFSSLHEALNEIDVNELVSVVISNPRRAATEYRKIRAERIENSFQISFYTKTQVFHQQIEVEQILQFCLENVGDTYKQIDFWQVDKEATFLISKKGKVHSTSRKTSPLAIDQIKQSHNRKKNYLIEEGMIIPALVDMGVLTADGKVIPSKYDKFKQINRFLELVDDEFKNFQSEKPLRIVDFGCGKAYLTFILYYYFQEIKQIPVSMIGLDLKEDVIEQCNKSANRYGYEHLHFEVGDIADYAPVEEVDVVVTLHACDTATDLALFNAVQWNAQQIFSVPCCQHEINKSIDAQKLKLLTRYGIIKEKFSALLTDAIRANLLECLGYETQVLEFIDMEHTPKNIMIRASKRNLTPVVLERRRHKYLEEVEAAIKEFQVEPTLYKMFVEGIL